jgi:hypothetical protein
VEEREIIEGGGAQVLVAYFTGGIVRAVRRKTVLTTLV